MRLRVARSLSLSLSSLTLSSAYQNLSHHPRDSIFDFSNVYDTDSCDGCSNPNGVLTEISVVAASSTISASWNEGKCFVAPGETLGPQMKDNIDLFGRDWIKYWSPNAEHNNGALDSPTTASAGACCEACESTPDCNMWTWTKSQQGCYLKKSSEETTYVERFDEGRISGGWDSSVHLDTNTFFDGDATSTTVQHAAFNTNGVMVGHENAGEIHTAATTEDVVDHDVDHFHRRLDVAHYLQGIDYPSEDFVKFSNGRPEARTPASCEEACTANEKCEYWSWSHNDPQASCYLKSNFAMADQSFGYGYPVRSANAHRSLRPAATLISPPHPTRIFFFFFFCAHNRPTPSASCRASCAAAPTALAPRGRSSFRRPSSARTSSSSPRSSRTRSRTVRSST